MWSERAGTVAGDRDAGASEILARLIPVVEQARVEAPEALPDMASIVAAAQPAMAGLHFLMRAAMADCAHPGRLAAAVAGVAAVARRAAVPVVVLASREKVATDPAFVPRAIGVAGAPDDVWAPVPAGVKVANPTFELVPWELADLLVTDRDALPAASISPNSFI